MEWIVGLTILEAAEVKFTYLYILPSTRPALFLCWLDDARWRKAPASSGL
jgi:hypothetical protein